MNGMEWTHSHLDSLGYNPNGEEEEEDIYIYVVSNKCI
jgi:hypothetical protein